MRSLCRDPNSWLTPVRYYAVLKWLETFSSPPSLFILPQWKPNSLAMRTCTQHQSQNMRRYDDINHEHLQKKKKAAKFRLGRPGTGLGIPSQPHSQGAASTLRPDVYIPFFFFFLRGEGARTALHLRLKGHDVEQMFSSWNNAALFFFFFLSPAGSARLLFVCQDFLLPLLYCTVFRPFFCLKAPPAPHKTRRISSRHCDQ